MANEADKRYMQRAIELAEKGRFKTSPNPMVGAVIVKKNRIIGEGYHRQAGADHAEIAALRTAKESVAGATMYVTLEPCCHTGRTGPCTDALIKAGIKRVVFGSADPDPRVKGKGARKLRRAGIEVTSGVLRQEVQRQNEIFFGFHTLGRPFIILKTAQTIDGRIATSTSDSKWVSGPESLKMAHRLRAEVDGIVVGGRTVLRDDPALTVRRVKGPNPYRIILSGSMHFPRKCGLIDNNKDFKTIVATTGKNVEKFSRSPRGKGLIMWNVKRDRTGRLDVNDVVKQAGQFGLQSLLVEGGNRVATSFLRAGLVDKYVAVIAPKMLGEGVNAIGDMKIKKIADAITLEKTKMISSGKDVILIGYPKWSK